MFYEELNFIKFDHAKLVGPIGRQRIAGHDHLKRRSHADRARQAKQASGRRHQRALYFGQAEIGFARADDHVAGQGDLRPTGKRAAGDGGD